MEQEFLQQHWIHVVGLGRNVRLLGQNDSLVKRGKKKVESIVRNEH